MAKKKETSTIDWLQLIIANAPAGVQTLVQLKNLFGNLYHEVRAEFGGGDLPLDELAEKLKTKIAGLAETQKKIDEKP